MASPFIEVPEVDWVPSNALAFAIHDRFPVSPGHTLVVTRRVVPSWFDATPAERTALLDLIDTVRDRLDVSHRPDGYNVGINVGEAAGQTVPHLHVHVIPRYHGDVDDPRDVCATRDPRKRQLPALRRAPTSDRGFGRPVHAPHRAVVCPRPRHRRPHRVCPGQWAGAAARAGVSLPWVEAARLSAMTDSRDRSVVVSTLMPLTCLVLGLLAGGMLVIGVSFVSFWKSLSASDFQAWFASHSHLIGRMMLPLGIGGVAATVAALVACWRDPATSRFWLLIAAFSVVGVMVTYPIFFAATNEAFERGGLSDSAVRALLDRWAVWHWVRTGLGIIGFFAALRAFQRS